MGNNFNLATFIVGILSLCGVIANIIVTSINSKKKRYTDFVTHRRLTTFQNIIDCSSKCVKALYGLMMENADDGALLQTFIENKTQIFFNINYKTAAEKELRDALDALQELTLKYVENKSKLTKEQKTKIFDTMRHGADYFQAISSVYFKCEWVRIKETSVSAKESVDDQKEYFERVKEIEGSLTKNKKILFENTFEKITKK